MLLSSTWEIRQVAWFTTDGGTASTAEGRTLNSSVQFSTATNVQFSTFRAIFLQR
jgi:hypothetical protein